MPSTSMFSTRAVLILVAALLVFWAVGAYNRLVRLRSAMVAAWGPLDAQLKRRHGLARELGEMLGGALPADAPLAERAVIEAVVAASRQADAACGHIHGRPVDAGGVQSLGVAERTLDHALRSLRRVFDAHAGLLNEPSLGERTESLMQALQQTEAQIAFGRQQHEQSVQALNAAVTEWPTRVIAALFNVRRTTSLPQPEPLSEVHEPSRL
ncbi:LemA family protein [Caldimonas sp. KR1-144]|uniref:LemA family protein n=1 Tax=Caldimonas sp. KR1-144 TaxID=3400911 RepID=UPI003BFD7215